LRFPGVRHPFSDATPTPIVAELADWGTVALVEKDGKGVALYRLTDIPRLGR